MMKYFLLIFLFVLISCNEPLGIEENVDKRILSKELFPLQIDNKWHYITQNYDENGNIESESQFSLKVVGTHFTKGKLWYQVENTKNPIEEHYYSHTNEGLWYRIPQYFPIEEFLILFYPTSEDEVLKFKDIYGLDEDIEIELKFVKKDYELSVYDVEFYCFQYNLYKINTKTNKRNLYKELFYSQGVGLVKEIEYKEVNNNVIITSKKILNIYNVEN